MIKSEYHYYKFVTLFNDGLYEQLNINKVHKI